MTDATAPTPETRLAVLAAERCRNGAPRLPDADAAAMAATLPGWSIVNGVLTKSFSFANFELTMAFVNAVADVARSQNHHPDLAVAYARCVVDFSTHDAGGLTRNDFICAARTEGIVG